MNIEQLKKQRDELDAQIKALEEDKPPFEVGQKYWGCGVEAYEIMWRGNNPTSDLYNAGLAFATREEAEAYIARRAATVRVNRAIERLNKAQGWVADWNDPRQLKCSIEYSYMTGRIKCVHRCWYQPSSIFLHMSCETAEAIIKSHEADILCAMRVLVPKEAGSEVYPAP